MVRRSLLVIFLSVVVATVTHAAKIPFVEEALQKELGNLQTIAQPEPNALEADWWRFFGVEGEELEHRVKTTLARLDALLKEIPQGTAETAKPFIDLIRANLQALPQVRAQPTPEFPSPPAYQEKYTLPEFLEIARRLRSTEEDIQAEKDDIATTEKNLKLTNRRIDTLLAAYLNLPKSDPDRVLRGLEIMAERSGIAIFV